jgi:putative ABC transport system permease protein
MNKLRDLINISFRRIKRNPRNYLLVFVSIFFGVSGLIVVLTMSREVKQTVNNDLALIGRANIIKIYFENQPNQRQEWFRDGTVTALRQLPGVQYVSLTARGRGVAMVGNQQNPVRVIGVDEFFWELNDYSARKGTLFRAAEVDQRKRKVVIGTIAAKMFFGAKEAVGATITIDSDPYLIIGLLSDMAPSNYQEAIFLPLTTAQDRIFKLSPPNIIYIRSQTWDDVPAVTKTAQALIQNRQPSNGMVVEVHWEVLKRVQYMSWILEFLAYLGVIFALCLGGSGIWNMMMAAVRARTREIGLKKAMGAEDKDILIEFLSEAVCVSLSAALIGIIGAWLMVEVLDYWIGKHADINFFLIYMGLGFLLALGLGIGAGIYPSLKASRMEVVEAVRYE